MRTVLLWLILLTACCPLFGQQQTALSSPKATKLGNAPYFYRRDTVIRPVAPIEELKPAGEFRLRRCGYTAFTFEVLPACDTLHVALANRFLLQTLHFFIRACDTLDLKLVSKSGVPFKKVQWASKTQGPETVFSYRDTMPQQRPPELKIKAGFSLKRRVAQFTLRRISPAWPFVLTEKTDTLIRDNPYGQKDTLVRRSWTRPGQTTALIDTTYSVMTLDSGRTIRHRSQQLMLKTRAYKPDTLLPKGTFGAPRFGKKVIRYEGFQKGDTVFFDVKVVGKIPLRSIALEDSSGHRLNGSTDALAFADTLVAANERYLTLHLTGTPAWKKQKVKIKVWRIRPLVVDSFRVTKDTFYRIDTLFVYDTLALTIKDDSLQLAPVLDIYNKPAGYLGRMEIQMPARLPDKHPADLSFVAYWIGIGRSCLADYQTIEKTVPANWSLPGAPVALGAYGKGRPLFLPHINTADVAMVFRESGKPIGPRETATLLGLSLLQNARVVPVKEFEPQLKPDPKSGLYHFFVCFNNKSTDMAYPVQVKMVAFYLKEKSRRREVKKVGATTVIKKLSAT